jgi:hypothetical protein
MSLVSKNSQSQYQDVKDQLVSLIRAHLPQSIAVGKLRKLNQDDLENILVGLALRFSDTEVAKYVNAERKQRGEDEEISYNLVFHYRKQFADTIDTLYGLAAQRVGELFKYADKLHRIGRYNAIASALDKHVMDDFTGPLPTEFGLKMANVYIKVLDRLNDEMGKKPLILQRNREDDDGQDKQLPKDEIAIAVKVAIEERYSKQLPPTAHNIIDFSDYKVCANGEYLGKHYVCWNESIAVDGKCAVQQGHIQTCPKFLNKTLLSDKNWMTEARDRKLSIKSISKLAGCADYDPDIRDRVGFYLKQHDLIAKVENTVNVDREDSSEGS